MAREIGKLKPIAVPRIKATGMYSDGGGLYLQVRESAEDEPARSWIFRYALHGKERYMGLGSLTTFSLAEARELARECRQKVSKGVDPLAAREEQRHAAGIAAARNITFRQAAEEYIEAHQSGWRNAKHAAQWPATLETYAYPIIGALPVQQIDAGLVRRVLEQIVTVSERDDSGAMVERRTSFWHAKTETANRVRGRIESILARATALGYRTGDNPARWRGHLAEAFPRRSKVQKVEHHPALPYSEIGSFVEALRLREGIAPRVLRVCRVGNLRDVLVERIDVYDRGGGDTGKESAADQLVVTCVKHQRRPGQLLPVQQSRGIVRRRDVGRVAHVQLGNERPTDFGIVLDPKGQPQERPGFEHVRQEIPETDEPQRFAPLQSIGTPALLLFVHLGGDPRPDGES